jgi:hypothetical protein
MASDAVLLRKAADHMVKADEQYEFHMRQAELALNQIGERHGYPEVTWSRERHQLIYTERP